MRKKLINLSLFEHNFAFPLMHIRQIMIQLKIKKTKYIGKMTWILKNSPEKINNENKMTFKKYSRVRGVQQYKIIFEALSRVDSNLSLVMSIHSFHVVFLNFP